MTRPVLTKADFVRRYKEGEFGNASPTWDTLFRWVEAKPWLATSRPTRYHIRSRIAGGPTWYNLPPDRVPSAYQRASEEIGWENLYISEMAPHDLNVLQGEVQRGLWGLDLTYSTVKCLPMRDALRVDTRHSQGIMALLLLRSAMDSNSYSWLEYLLDAYPNHVVEFSSFTRAWGTVPGYNTVFWEVRRY